MVKKSFFWLYRASLTLLWVAIIIVAGTILALRYLILPNIESHKDDIAQRASSALGQKVTIEKIEASWEGMNPHLSLVNVLLHDAQNRPALKLEQVETSISWLSIPLLEPRLSHLMVNAPDLVVRRESNGNLFVAGIPMSGPSRPEFSNWVLRQSRVDIVNATVVWKDDLRKAPDLSLTKLHLAIINPALGGLVGKHQIALHAYSSVGTDKPLDLRATLYGRDISKADTWSGKIYGQLQDVDIAAWHAWLDYPLELNTGYGAMRFWFDFAKGKPTNFTTDVALSGVKTKFSAQNAELNLNKLSGRLFWKRYPDGQQMRAERINVDSADGLNIDNGLIDLRQGELNGKPRIEGDVQLTQFNLLAASRFARYLPLPENALKYLDAIAPTGVLESINVQWRGPQEHPDEYKIQAAFKNLGMQAYQQIPGFSKLTGSVEADQDEGVISLSTQGAMLDLKEVMRWPIPLDKLAGEVKWKNSKNSTEIALKNVAISNAEINGVVNGTYRMDGVKGGYIDLTGRFPYADAKTAKHYYPKIMGKDTLEWLDKSILAGKIQNVDLTLKGYLNEFPFVGKDQGLFKVTADLSEGVLDYGDGWPRIDDIKLKLTFQGPGLTLDATGGRISGTKIIKAHGVIPVLDADDPILTIVSEGRGHVRDGIEFINHSPVLEITDGFTQGLTTTGEGILNLSLVIPLNDTDRTKVKGVYQIINGSMSSDAIPDLSKINGSLEFNEHALTAKHITTWVFGGPAQFNLTTGKNHLIKIAASGHVTDVGLRDGLKLSLLDQISGGADWSGDITIQQQQLEIDVRTNLVGMASNWPAPLNKAAADTMPFRYNTSQKTSAQDVMSVSVGSNIAAKFQRLRKNGNLEIERGQIGVNVSPEMPEQPGVNVNAVLSSLDADAWLAAFNQPQAASSQAKKQSGIEIGKVDLSVNSLAIFNRKINELKLQAKPIFGGWKMDIQSQEVAGEASWLNQGSGKISAKLKNLNIPTSGDTAVAATQTTKSVAQYPSLDISAENFQLGQKKLGNLELQAQERGGNWVIDKLNITNPDSSMKADGEWRSWKRAPNTRMNVNWVISDLGKTLDRFGYPSTIKGGTANLQGQLSWPNSPHEFEAAKLNGNLKLEALNGQILKVQPGVGRLFSMLTLQNLPRRLTFDFRDVFSDGFTFDKISANVRINQGEMRSENFKLKGPTALVEMKGQTDLSKETQHLHIKVTPYVSDSVSLAALAGGPAVAAAAYLAQKLLKDPLNQLARDEYEIVGTWANPVEVKTDAAEKVDDNQSKPLGK